MIEEGGSDLAGQLWATNHRATSSVLSYVEARAALAAARRGRRLTPRRYTQAVEAFDDLRRGLDVVGVDEPLVRSGAELAEEHGLRGYDAIHLAAALSIAGSVTVVTWDGDLANAASRCGLGVAPPTARR